jgi:hypothetical protein
LNKKLPIALKRKRKMMFLSSKKRKENKKRAPKPSIMHPSSVPD